MATVNFSIPEQVKEAFNAAFAGQNRPARGPGVIVVADASSALK